MQCRFRFRRNCGFVAGFLRLNAIGFTALFPSRFRFRLNDGFVAVYFALAVSSVSSDCVGFHFKLNGGIGSGFRWNAFGFEREK
jgi:hypothetical protein